MNRPLSISLRDRHSAILAVSLVSFSVIPVKSPIHPDILNEQAIDFAIDENGMLLAGCGFLWAVRGSDGTDYVEMTYQADDCSDKMWLKQELVDRLKQRPSGNGFVLTAAL